MSAGPIQFTALKNYINYTLYGVAGAGSAQACYLYYFAPIADQTVSFSDSLKKSGIYIFADTPNLGIVNNLLGWLNNQTSGISLFWVNQVTANQLSVQANLQIPVPDKNPPPGQATGILSGLNLFFANFQLQYTQMTGAGPRLTIDGATQTATITIPTGRTVSLNPYNASQPSLSIDSSTIFTIPFAIAAQASKPEDTPVSGSQPGGTFAFTAKAWNVNTLYTLINGPSDSIWGGAIRYYFKNEQGVLQKTIFPVFGPAVPNDPPSADFLVQLDWLYPTYPAQTFFQPADPAQAPGVFQWNQLNALTTTGDSVGLLSGVNSNPGLYLTVLDPGTKSWYLSPYGTFTLQLPKEQTSARIMPGLSALEFMQIDTGYTLQLVPNQPAYSPAFSTSAGGNTPVALLDPTFLTSWIRINPPSGGSSWGYFSQPAAMSFYGNTEGDNDYNLAELLEVKIGTFPFPASQASPAVPCGLYYNFLQKFFSPNSNNMVAAANLFDQKILAAVRFARLSGAADSSVGPVLFSNQGAPFTQGNALSSNGLIFGVNAAEGKAGTPNTLTLAKSGTNYLRIHANEQGILDPRLSLALMNNQGFVVINAWDQLSLDDKLPISGFTFNVNTVDVSGTNVTPIMVFKMGQQYSLRQFVQNTQTWANTGTLLKDGVEAAQVALLSALAQAKSPNSADDPFQNFRQIADDPNWTGLLIFNCPLDGSQMDPDFQMLFAGIDGPLIAHHIGVETNQTELTGTLFDINTSSLFGVINYKGQDTEATGEVYGFTVKELVIVFDNSTITAFHASVGLTVNQLFGRPVYLQGPNEGIPNTFYIQGQYQTIGGVGRVSFNSTNTFIYQFNPDQNFVSALDQFAVTGASLEPLGNTDSGNQQIVKSRFTLNAQLFFSNPLTPGQEDVPDLFGYGVMDQGQSVGLSLTGTAFDIQVTLDAQGQPVTGSQSVTIDTSNWAIQENKNAVRKDSVVAAMPFKLSSLLQSGSENKLDSKALGQVVSIQQLAGNGCTAPHYALKFELPMGTLGALSEAYASIDAYMVMAWGPADTAPDNDGVSVYIQLPEVSGGLLGFNLEGIVKTVFGDANLMQVKLTDQGDQIVYVLLFNNVAISILGIKLPPKVIIDFVVFADPSQGSGSNLAWNLAAGQPQDNVALLKETH